MNHRIQVSTDIGRGLRLEKITPKMYVLHTPTTGSVLFWEWLPFGYIDEPYIYVVNDIRGAPLAGLTMHYPSMSRMSVPIDVLEYHVGQALSKAGLMLVRRLDS